jgi:CHAT domain-containing protein/tetratricopeptide (TPR) repeat protein
MHVARFIVPSLLAFASVGAFAADPCVPRSAPLATFDFAVERAVRVQQQISVPAGTRVLVEVFETGNNLRFEMRDAGVTHLADNALRRWAPQRMLLAPGAARTVSLAVIGQERTLGRATVRVHRLSPQDDARCVGYWERAAVADAEFSLGELLSEGKLTGEPASSERAYEAAARNYARAAEAAVPLGGLLAPMARLTQAAAELIGIGAFEQAAASARTAEQGFMALGHEYGRDRARFFWARTQIYLAQRARDRAAQERQLDQAHDTFVAVSESHRRRAESYDAAFALTWAAFVQARADRYVESIAEYQKALDAFAPLDEPARKLQLRQNIANAQFEIGRFREALANYSAALQDSDPEEEIELHEVLVMNVAYTEYRLGKLDAALRHYSQALQLARRIQSPDYEARSLHGLGITYHAVGNFHEALDYLYRALEIRTVKLDPAGRSATLRALADVLRDSGRVGEGLVRHQEALDIATQSPLQLARIRIEIARDHADLGDFATVSKVVRELLADETLQDPIVRARATALGVGAALAEGRLDVAARDAVAVTGYFQSQQLLMDEFGGLLLQARIACARGDRGAALGAAEQAMRRAEEIRISSNNPALRASLWAPLRPAFDFTIGVLAGTTACGPLPADPEAALAVAEASRNRALDDFRRRLAPHAGGGGDAQSRELFGRLADLRAQIENLSDRVPADDPRLRLLRDDVATLTREIDLAGGEDTSPGVDSASLQRSLRIDRSGLPSQSAAIEYWLGADRAIAWVVTHERIRMFDLGPTASIDTAARALHEAMRDWTRVALSERLKRTSELQALILAPLLPELAHSKTLHFIADGTLHTVPFAALTSGGGREAEFLVDAHDVGVVPTLRSVGAPGRALTVARALVVADPVYSRQDARFAARAGEPVAPAPAMLAENSLRGAHSWNRLPASGREATEITRLLGPASVETLSGFDASRAGVLSHELGRYQYIHFAAHAVADAEAPQLSALILSTVDAAGRPRAGEVFAGDFLTQRLNAELVVLSGCDTALGQASAGEGLLGMRYAAHAAGARSVVASLWPVMDASGSRLMRDLYTGIIRERLTPVAALSRAMRAARRQWQDPALWAAFDVSTGPGS